jgi:protein-L-isoaspartate(D-aspartate) O-methyltransferase
MDSVATQLYKAVAQPNGCTMPDVTTPDFADLRRRMVDCQLRTFSVFDDSVLFAVLNTPREVFLEPASRSVAYSDAILSVSAGGVRRQLLTPMVLARLLQTADIRPTDRLLDVGGATGYSAAVSGRLAGSVVALESESAFSEIASKCFADLHLSNVSCATGPLEAGAPGQGPFDVIVVAGAVEEGLDSLLGQLAEGGRLVTVLRSPGQTGLAMKAVRYERVGRDVGMRVAFDATGAVLPAFARKPAFVF